MSFRLLETVVLRRDLPDSGLKACDLGTVVELYPSDAAEVEFVTAGGKTRAVLTLDLTDLRPVSDDDLLAVRRLTPEP